MGKLNFETIIFCDTYMVYSILYNMCHFRMIEVMRENEKIFESRCVQNYCISQKLVFCGFIIMVDLYVLL